MLADLDAISHRERPAPDDEEPPCQIEENVLEGDRDTRRDQAEEVAELAEASREPELDDQQEADRRGDVGGRLLPAVAQPGVVRAPPQDAEDEPAHSPDRQHHDQAVEDLVFRRPADAERRLNPAVGLGHRASPPGFASPQYGILCRP